MTLKQLKELACENGVSLSSNLRKKDILESIEYINGIINEYESNNWKYEQFKLTNNMNRWFKFTKQYNIIENRDKKLKKLGL